MEWVAARRGAKVELAGDVTVGDTGDERDRVAIAAEQRHSKEHVIEAMVMAATLNTDPVVLEKMLGNQPSFLAR